MSIALQNKTWILVRNADFLPAKPVDQKRHSFHGGKANLKFQRLFLKVSLLTDATLVSKSIRRNSCFPSFAMFCKEFLSQRHTCPKVSWQKLWWKFKINLNHNIWKEKFVVFDPCFMSICVLNFFSICKLLSIFT